MKQLTRRGRCHHDVRDVIHDVNDVVRGWGNYFGTGSAAAKFVEIDRYVVDRLRELRIERKGRHLEAGETRRWTRDYFESFGLHRLRGTVRYPVAA